VLYFLGGFAGNVFSFLLTEGYSVGASTAVFGLVAARVIFFYQNRKLLVVKRSRQLATRFSSLLSICSLAWRLVLITGACGRTARRRNICLVHRSALGSGGNLPGFHLPDQHEFREIVLGASVALLVFGALAAWGLFSG
jgi:membrane associated rhomboid family serine protease